jgi:hypothetical protein
LSEGSPEAAKRKTLSERALIVSVSATVSVFAAVALKLVEAFDVLSGLLLATLLFASYRIFFSQIEKRVWLWNRGRKFRNPRVGLLLHEGCPILKLVTPTDWRDGLQQKALTVKEIQISGLNSRYAIVLNPYGEFYPEEDSLAFLSFKKIRDYISSGGIFVCAHGLAFFYSYDMSTKKATPTGGEHTLYAGTLSNNVVLLQPAFSRAPLWSLVDTLLRREFRVLTTASDNPQTVSVYQLPEDKQWVGDLTNVGGSSTIEEFRAVREPAPRCIPLLRAKTDFGEVYPMAAIPFGKGYLVLCGMNFDSSNAPLRTAQLERVLTGLANLLKRAKEGRIGL